MNLEELVATEDLCTKYSVEGTFIRSLNDSGLLEIITVEKTEYVHCDNISDFEKLRRMHYDLHINIEGLEAVENLLNQVKKLQKSNLQLRNRLNLYE
ncbi:MerR HTH family regulatory protein [Gillisia sp. Hel1_33_143]|uniref:chaperone modulator CbpM n=1 Tax=Gillisia sp. Hel1_33_143 TaxID=1336796 RepID=UPI00087ADA1A|nr:chaperone modulator CbpM [Gillisia sp. Hel1_33_143]SDR92043.1 MerR HTH family regulatory protein [Gillisia sp. Hel1_33_143]